MSRIWTNWNPHTLLVGKQNGAAVWKTVWQFFKLLNRLTVSPSNLTSLYMPKTKEDIRPHKNLYTNFNSIIHNGHKVKQLMCPSADKWINKMWYIHTRDYYSTIRRNVDTCSNMDKPWKRYAKPRSQTEGPYLAWFLLYENFIVGKKQINGFLWLGSRGKQNEELLLWSDENVITLNCDDSCTVLWIY